jgi:hypothetical protein
LVSSGGNHPVVGNRQEQSEVERPHRSSPIVGSYPSGRSKSEQGHNKPLKEQHIL